ncbi:nucleoside diphosphate kinase A-like isoform X2 [Lissotriton helveticus]
MNADHSLVPDFRSPDLSPGFLQCVSPGQLSKIGNMADSGSRERTMLLIKPDGVQRGLVGKIITRFEEKGYLLVAMKLTQASEDLYREHYTELKDEPFYARLVKYLSGRPVVPMVWEGYNVVKMTRLMLGQTDPTASEPGTIRADYCIEAARNACHGSDNLECAKREINLWFKPEELISYTSCTHQWIYDEH